MDLINKAVLNYGEDTRGAVQVVPAPIVDAKRSLYRDLYKTLLANPNFQTHELSALDLDALKDTLGLPKSTEIDRLGKQPTSPVPGELACGGGSDDNGEIAGWELVYTPVRGVGS